jgi:CRISPR system Cascade subunit CasD
MENAGSMSHVLLLRLAAPMQSWGLHGRFTVRDTVGEPTKSGVIGMVCAALGRDRMADISDLAALRYGVRTLMEGRMEKDFHTALDVIKASGAKGDTVISDRYYLSDAWFIAGLEGNSSLLEKVHDALLTPHWPLFLGRRAFPPTLPVAMGPPFAGDLISTLLDFQDPAWERFAPKKARMGTQVVVDANVPVPNVARILSVRTQPDQPVSFGPRKSLPRRINIIEPINYVTTV